MYVLRRPSVRPGPRAFWLGGVCEGAAGMASVGRDGIGEGAQLDSVLGGSLRELAHAVRGATGAGREVHAAAGIPRSRRCLAAGGALKSGGAL